MKIIKRKIKKMFKMIGPGLTTGLGDNDASGIAAYTQTGAMFGLQQLWLALFALPFMLTIQEMCGRLGMVTGKGLAALIKENYSKPFLYFVILLLAGANILNIGADLGAMASSMEMVTGGHPIFWISILTILVTLLQISFPYKKYATILKYCGIFLCAYVVTAFLSKENWNYVMYCLCIPTIVLTSAFIFNMMAFLGTTISPYLFFWQASEEVEEAKAKNKISEVGIGEKPKRVGEITVRNIGVDTAVGMGISNFIAAAIIITGSLLNRNGITDIATAPQAAEALRPFLGEFAYIIFAAAIVGISFLAIPVLCGSLAYALCETFGWQYGMNKKLRTAKEFYGIMVISMVIGMIMNLCHLNAIKALYYSAAFNGFAAPFLMIFIILLSNKKTIMGKYKNKKWQSLLGWIITSIMIVCGIITIGSAFV